MVRKTNRNRHEIVDKIEELQERQEGAERQVELSGDPAGRMKAEKIEGKIEALRWVLAHRHEL